MEKKARQMVGFVYLVAAIMAMLLHGGPREEFLNKALTVYAITLTALGVDSYLFSKRAFNYPVLIGYGLSILMAGFSSHLTMSPELRFKLITWTLLMTGVTTLGHGMLSSMIEEGERKVGFWAVIFSLGYIVLPSILHCIF